MSVVFSGTTVRRRARGLRDGCFFNLRRPRRRLKSRRRLEHHQRLFRGFAQTFARFVGLFRSCRFRIGRTRRFLRANRRAGGRRARPSRCLFRAGIGRLGGGHRRRRPRPRGRGRGGATFRVQHRSRGHARVGSAGWSHRTGCRGGAGQRIAPRIVPVPYARIVSTKDDVGRRVGNGGRRRTLGVDAAVHYLRRAHDTTRSTPSEEEGVQRPAPRARDCFVANSALTMQSITFSERFGNRQHRPKRGVRPTSRYVCVAVSDFPWHADATRHASVALDFNFS